eukprot:scaffold30710_cov61-Phaeocystis_antarctica.AAC.5
MAAGRAQGLQAVGEPLGVSVLSLDTDAALFNDVYPLLHAPPLGAHDVLISKNGDASGSLNCGFVYFNLHAGGGSGGGGGGGGAAGGGGAEPCGQRGCASCASGHSEAAGSEAAATAGSERVVPAAEWAALVLWERFTLFLEIDRASLRRPPSSQVCEGAVGGMHGQCIPHVRCMCCGSRTCGTMSPRASSSTGATHPYNSLEPLRTPCTPLREPRAQQARLPVGGRLRQEERYVGLARLQASGRGGGGARGSRGDAPAEAGGMAHLQHAL